MSTKANIGYNLDEQVGIVEAVATTDWHVISKNANGIALVECGSADSAAQISANRTAAGSPNCSPGCLVILGAASSTQPLWVNVAAVGSVVWTSISAIAGD